MITDLGPTNLGGSSLLSRFSFYFSGLIVCLWRGKLDRYSYLIAQAKFEVGANFDAHWFNVEQNPWCMHAGSITSRRSGEVTADGGKVAVYESGWTSGYTKAWMDRLDWDQAHNPEWSNSKDKSLASYMDAINTDVGSNNWSWRGYNVSDDKKASYKLGVKAMWAHVPTLAKGLTGLQNMVPFNLAWILAPVALIALYFLGRWLYRKWKAR